MKIFIPVLLMLICFLTPLQAQKYGHLNYGNVLEAMPDTKAANSELESYRDQLLASHQAKLDDFQKEYATIQKKVAEGSISKAEAQAESQRLQEKQNTLMQEEQKLSQDMALKRQELLTPIIDKLQNAIESYGQENRYTMIFDTSLGAMLFADDSQDLTGEIKAKLGL